MKVGYLRDLETEKRGVEGRVSTAEKALPCVVWHNFPFTPPPEKFSKDLHNFLLKIVSGIFSLSHVLFRVCVCEMD